MPSFAVQDVCVNWLMNFCGSSALAGAVNATLIISKTHSDFGEIWSRAGRPQLRPDRPMELIISSVPSPASELDRVGPFFRLTHSRHGLWAQPSTRTLSDFISDGP